MANNLLDRILSITGLTAPESEGKNSEYSNDGLTGVERYLAKLVDDEVQHDVPESSLSGVEKYLRMQSEAEAEKVDKGQAKPLSRVDKYLASQETKKTAKPASGVKKPAAVKKPASGVDKYLNQQSTDVTKSVPVAKKKAKPAAKKTAAVKQPAKTSSAAAVKKVVEKPVQKTAPKPSAGRIDLSVDVDQCQAGTARGGQCKRTTSLMKLQRTISKQKYQFLVCSQHHNDSFKPYKGLI